MHAWLVTQLDLVKPEGLMDTQTYGEAVIACRKAM